MKTLNNYDKYYTSILIKNPVKLEMIVENSDPIYAYNETTDKVEPREYIVVKGNKVGRLRLD